MGFGKIWRRLGKSLPALLLPLAWQKSAVALCAFDLWAQVRRAMADILSALWAERMEAGGVEPRGTQSPMNFPF